MRERLIQLIKQAHTDYLLNDDYAVSIYEFIADRLIEAGVILPQVKVGQTVWYINRVPGTSIHSAKIVEIYYNGEFFAVRVETKLGSCFDVMFEKDEIFLTREAAEAALKAREKQ
jgi:hypothetical protein